MDEGKRPMQRLETWGCCGNAGDEETCEQGKYEDGKMTVQTVQDGVQDEWRKTGGWGKRGRHLIRRSGWRGER